MEVGTVVEVKDKLVIVKMQRTEACNHCKICPQSMLIEAKNLCNACVGDLVKVKLSEEAFLKAAFIMYLIPFLAMMLGFFIGLQFSELFGFLFGICLAVLSYFIISRFEKNIRKKNFMPEAVQLEQLPQGR